KGMAGARMQQIADKAGINKSLLHYYYRSKEKLFSIIFKVAFKTFAPDMLGIFKGDDDFFFKIRQFVLTYLSVLEKNPHIPGFILHEISHRPDNLVKLVGQLNIDISFILDQIEDEIQKGNIRPIDPKQLLINIISLCVFPIVAKPMISSIILKGDELAYQNLLEERKLHIADFVINSIKL
ncbi:MAG: TetR family transcriptional regulator, partial [Bacteroidales bacterium]|nr:TetR family transcriptional regulator [Bacteroidales bacterium]